MKKPLWVIWALGLMACLLIAVTHSLALIQFNGTSAPGIKDRGDGPVSGIDRQTGNSDLKSSSAENSQAILKWDQKNPGLEERDRAGRLPEPVAMMLLGIGLLGLGWLGRRQTKRRI